MHTCLAVLAVFNHDLQLRAEILAIVAEGMTLESVLLTFIYLHPVLRVTSFSTWTIPD